MVEIEDGGQQPGGGDDAESTSPLRPLSGLGHRRCRQQRTRDTARPPSDVSLYFGFISLAVIAKAVHRRVEIDAAIGRDLVLGDEIAGPRLHRAERAALDAGNLDEAGDRIAGHSEVVLERAFRGIGGDLRRRVLAPGAIIAAPIADATPISAWQPPSAADERRVVLAQIADDRGCKQRLRAASGRTSSRRPDRANR